MGSRMLQAIKAFALFNNVWVLYLLIGLSLWGLAVIFDRYFLFRKLAKDAERLGDIVPVLLAKGDFGQVRKLVENSSSPEGVILKAGLVNLSMEREALEQILESSRIQEKLSLEKNLLVL